MTYLSEELETYDKIAKIILMTHTGEYVVVHGEEFSFWDTYPDAIKYGYETYGLCPFLVKQIQAINLLVAV